MNTRKELDKDEQGIYLALDELGAVANPYIGRPNRNVSSEFRSKLDKLLADLRGRGLIVSSEVKTYDQYEFLVTIKSKFSTASLTLRAGVKNKWSVG